MVEVAEDLVRRLWRLVVLLGTAGVAGAPEAVVEDDVLDVEVVGVSDEPMRDHPARAPVVLADRPEEDVDRAAVIVRRLTPVALIHPAGLEAAEALLAEDLRRRSAHLFRAA